MTHPSARPPIAQMPFTPPAQVQFFFDPAQRMVRLQYRGQLDLANSTLDLPVAFLKQIVGQVMQIEGQLELQGPPAR